MSEYYHQHAEPNIFWDILETVSEKLTTRYSTKEIKAAIEHEAREYGLSDDEIETLLTYAFDIGRL